MSVCKCQRNKVNLYDFGFFQNQYVLSGYELSEANLIIVIPNRSFRYLSPIRLEFEISFSALVTEIRAPVAHNSNVNYNNKIHTQLSRR
jgi:hypothetical protein